MLSFMHMNERYIETHIPDNIIMLEKLFNILFYDWWNHVKFFLVNVMNWM